MSNRTITPPRARPASAQAIVAGRQAARPAVVAPSDELVVPVYLESKFWIYLIVAAVVYGIYWFLMNNAQKSGTLASIQKPANMPSGTVFAVIWALVFLFLAYSTSVGTRYSPNENHKMWLNAAFGLNLVLVLLWAILFYQQKNPKAAFWILILLFLSTLWMAWLVYQVNKPAGFLFVVYLIWLIYMGYLNWQITSLNPQR